MYAEFYGLSEDPFRLTPDRQYRFDHPSFRKAWAYLRYGIQRAEGFIMVTGRPGTGKTTLIGAFLDELPADSFRVARLLSTRLEGGDLIRMVAYAFNLPAERQDKATLLREIEGSLKRDRQAGRRGLLIVDEAQDLPASALEELRLLTNLESDGAPLIQIFLVGQEELRDIVSSREMEQLHQRLIASCHLKPLTLKESFGYVRYRLQQARWNGDPVITPNVFGALVQASGGIPRRINQVCSRLLMHGFVEDKHRLGVADLRIVLQELREERLLPTTDDHASIGEEIVDSAALEDELKDEQGSLGLEDADMAEESLEVDAGEQTPIEDSAGVTAWARSVVPLQEETAVAEVEHGRLWARDEWSDAQQAESGARLAAQSASYWRSPPPEEELAWASYENGAAWMHDRAPAPSRVFSRKQLISAAVIIALAVVVGLATSIPSVREWTLKQALGFQQTANRLLVPAQQRESIESPPSDRSQVGRQRETFGLHRPSSQSGSGEGIGDQG